MTLTLPGTSQDVTTFEEASKVLRTYIDSRGWGSTQWYGQKGDGGFKVGDIVQDGNKIAHISYNGRVWPEGASS